MKWSSIWVAAFFAALTFAAWAWLNRPSIEPRWPARVQGVAYSPYHAGQSPRTESPTAAEIDADLRLLSLASVNAVRTYSSTGVFAQVPEIAARHNLKVLVGARVIGNRDNDVKELADAIAAAKRSNVIRVIVGNETILHGVIRVPDLIAHLDQARSQIEQPVSTAEPWHVWLAHPELAAHVDFLAVHMLPYWEGIEVNQAIAHIDERMQQLKQRFPGREIVIAEVGWPSEGRTREQAVASLSNEATFLRRFLDQAEHKGYLYYVMEAFDQPWKARDEGTAGAYWGIYNVHREAKFAFTAPVVRIPGWQRLATISVLTAALLLSLFFAHSRALGTRGRSFLAVVVYGTATAAVLMTYDYSQRYLSFFGALAGAVLMLGLLGAIGILLAEAHEWVEARWSKHRRADTQAILTATFEPKVSIHVPAFNEPAAMLIATLDALSRLDYQNFEVLVIDNNTHDASVWQPVMEHCAELGPRFKFFHIDPLQGFKAGALNHALQHTAVDADIVAVIDSDYQVDPSWLRHLVPTFADAKVAIVQAPQDYRDGGKNLFKSMAHAEYRGFFYIGMITRNERNAIIQHGTMTLVRKQALRDVGGWAEWSITEDAELGLRLFEHGWIARYIPISYGRGLVPDTFADYKKQRFRWVYGAMQIVRRHRDALFGLRDERLTRGQRYHFIAGWLPWFAEGFNLLFNLGAIAWSIAMLIAPHRIEPPLIMFSVLPLTLFTFRMAKLAHLYISRVGANVRQTVAAAIAGLALSHTVGLAVLKGLVTRNEPFFRTPKLAQRQVISEAISDSRQELLFLIGLCAAAYALSHSIRMGPVRLGIPAELTGPDVSLWVAVLLIQAVPYAATFLVSLISATNLPARWIGGFKSMRAPELEAPHKEAVK